MPPMQEDPIFQRVYERSFILQKYDDLDIPLVKKQPSIRNHALTTFFLSSLTHFILYPLDTIKTRLIGSNKVTDIANFQLNKTKTETAYLGLFRGYFSVFIGNTVYLAIGRQDLVKGAVVQGFLRTWVDMMKISKQMANKNADLTIMKKSVGWATLTAILRDLTYRGSFAFIYSKLNDKFLQGGLYDQGIKMNNMFVSVMLSTIISHPLQVFFVKIASQRQLKYTNMISTGIQIIREEGMGKLTTSGLWARLLYNLASTSIMFNFYDKTLQASLQAI